MSEQGDEVASGEGREVNGDVVVRRENRYGVMKDHVRVELGTSVLEVPRRLKNPITERRHDLTKLSDDGYLKPFLAHYYEANGDSVVNLSTSPVLTFDRDKWELAVDASDGHIVLTKRDVEVSTGAE